MLLGKMLLLWLLLFSPAIGLQPVKHPCSFNTQLLTLNFTGIKQVQFKQSLFLYVFFDTILSDAHCPSE